MHNLYKQGNLPYLNVKLCPKCNELVKLEEEVCSKCSYNFVTKDVEKKEEVTKKEYTDINDYAKDHAIATKNAKINKEISEEKTEEFERQEIVNKNSKEKFIFCDNCGAKIVGSQKYCGGCGAKVSKMICPSCEQIIESNLTYCNYCGKKVNDTPSNVEKVEEHVNEQVIETEDTIVKIKLEKEEKTEPIKTEEISVVEPISLDTPLNEIVKMKRKRVFVSIQLFFTLVILFLAIMLPLLTKESFFASIIPSFKNTNNETVIAGKDFIVYIFDCFSKGFDLSRIEPSLKGLTDGYIFTGMKFADKFFGLFGDIHLMTSFVIVSLVYALIFGNIIALIITSITGLIRKTPYKGSSLTVTLISLAIGVLLIYTNIFSKNFYNFDSWILYAFALVFFYWFIVKIVFGKETRIYKATKKANKTKK